MHLCDLCSAPSIEPEWRVIPGYEGMYEVSSTGRVRRLPHLVRARGSRAGKWYEKMWPGHEIARCDDSAGRGYFFVRLWRENCQRSRKVHQLVLEAFVGPRPEDKHGVNHIDGDTKHNCVTNLEWATRSENQRHARATGLNKSSFQASSFKLTVEERCAVRALHRAGVPANELAKSFNITPQYASCLGRLEAWRGGIFSGGVSRLGD